MAVWFHFLVLGAAAVAIAAGQSPQAKKAQREKWKKEAAEAESKELEREKEEKKVSQEAHFERGLATLMGKTQTHSEQTVSSVSIEKDMAAFRSKKIKSNEEKVSESIHKDLQEAQKFQTENKLKMSESNNALAIAQRRLDHAKAQSRIVDALAKEEPKKKQKLVKVKQPHVDHSVIKAAGDMTPAEATAAIKERKSIEETEKAYRYLKSRVKS
eukprot:gnl/MRDRNA2_/MRDRNA2_88268_c0_seq1.p1 gnl/MRDRNA2_/MRDRNA2_88268_c0~~gnl/MRDRNA2_/MRDRNA2_88268_c0_seq1.p1  ORF type:complete len:214 (+),score=68.59 gnl/MRDRNA2_/MRDRNA2_88268_c0_seq1:105-746(+)